MDMEKDAKRIQALDKGSDALSQQMRKLRQKADDFIGLAQDLSSNYAQHINSANSLLAHFQVCVSRASARRKGSVGDSDHDELTKVHLVTSQVLKSYLLWLERSKHRRQIIRTPWKVYAQ